MKASPKILTPLLFLFILLVLIAPFLQSKFNFADLTPLKGAITKHDKAVFSFSGWFSGEYQEDEEAYLNDSFGFRSFFVRINNQLAFSFFNKAKANGVIIGKDNFLFEENYIKAYYGTDYVGDDSIVNSIKRIKLIQDSLSKLNKDIILVFAAGKGSFYPEYFPDKYQTKKQITNYEKYVELAQSAGINYIDFNKYFIDNKSKSLYPLYPQYGIHWSTYGMCLVADSLIKYIENKRKIDMPDLYWDNISIEQPKGTDYDIADGMNIKFRLKSFDMAYPRLRYESDSGKVKPSVLVVADSYYWGMFNFGLPRVFSDSHFWFYNKKIYPDSYTASLETSDVNLEKEIERHDVIIIMATEATLPRFGWGFIERAYDLFTEQKPDSIYNENLRTVRMKIINNDEWMESIRKKAAKRNIEVDSMITLDAMWVINQEMKQK